MKILTAVIAAAAFAVAAPSMAEDVLVKDKCATCHDATAKKIGPTWKEVNAKNADVAAAVTAALASGSKGKYGKIPMPPQPAAKADAAALAKAIAALK